MFHYTDYIATVDVTNRQKEIELEVFLPVVPFAIAAALKLESQRADFVSVQFLSDRTMRRYHAKYFDDSSSTDCMSFPIDTEEDECTGVRILGEIFVCPQIALSVSKHIHSTLQDELSLYLIHGTLHLLGYNDITASDRSIMRQKEHDAMQLLKNCT